MGKLKTFYRYAVDFVKHGELHYLLSSIKYMLTGRPTNKSGIYKSDLGTFYVRKGTLDFQFGNSAYEWNVKKFVYQHVNNYNKFIDVGANIGTYTILFCNKGLEGCAFEPVSDNFQVLKKNVALNKVEDKVQLFQMGLGEYQHQDEFVFDPINTGATHSITFDNPEANQGKIEKAIIVPLDSIIEKCNFDEKKDKVFIKIDVEGMELNVLKGAKHFLKEFPEIALVIETVHSGRENVIKQLKEIDDRFEIYDVDDLNLGAVKSVKRNT